MCLGPISIDIDNCKANLEKVLGASRIFRDLSSTSGCRKTNVFKDCGEEYAMGGTNDWVGKGGNEYKEGWVGFQNSAH